jgi:hypothetical protein
MVMAEFEAVDLPVPAERGRAFAWLPMTLFRPVRAMRAVGSETRPVWLIPLLLLSALTLISVFVTGPLMQEAIRSGVAEPPDFQYMSPEQQQQYMQAQEIAAGPATTYTFPAVGRLVSLWFGWFLLGGILHLVLTLLGSRSNNTSAFNLAAWSSLPFAIRLIVQIGAMLVTHRLIDSPGLSGFLAEDAKGWLAFARSLLAMVDLYWLWQFALLWIGASLTAGLTRRKAFAGVLITILLMLVLGALPGFALAQLSGLNVNQPFFFMF